MSTRLATGRFVGTLRSSRSVQGLTLAETAYAPGLAVPSHVHDSATLALVIEGAMTEQRGRTGKLLEQGGLLFHPPHEPHGHVFHASGARCFIVQFGEPWTDRLRSLGESEPRTPFGLHASRVNFLAQALYREFLEDDAASCIAVEGLALAILGELSRTRATTERGRPPTWLRQAEELLRARSADTPSMAGIAVEVGVHPTHLARSFRRYHGRSMGEYLRGLRAERARRELVTTSKSIALIAAEAGFADQAHFTRVFKRLTGHTPRQYRLSHPAERHPD